MSKYVERFKALLARNYVERSTPETVLLGEKI